MEHIANRLSSHIANQLNYDEDKKAVIAYGLTAILQIIITGGIISIIGALLGFWYESFTIFLGVGILKKTTGGAHSSTILGCTIVSIVSITIFSALSKFFIRYPLNTNYLLISVIYLFCLIIFYIKVPVDSPNKPIRKQDKIHRLRIQSFAVLTLYIILDYILNCIASKNDRLFSISVCLNFTLVWQSLMLTKAAQSLIRELDIVFLRMEIKS